MKIDLVAEVEKTHIQTIYDMIDYFISKRRLLSRGDALEILVLQSGKFQCNFYLLAVQDQYQFIFQVLSGSMIHPYEFRP